MVSGVGVDVLMGSNIGVMWDGACVVASAFTEKGARFTAQIPRRKA